MQTTGSARQYRTLPVHTVSFYFSSTVNLPSFTVSISKALASRPLWSAGEKLKMPAVADQALDVLDGRSDLFLVRVRACILEASGQDDHGVVGMAAEGADVLLEPGLVALLVGKQERLLGVLGGQHVGDEQTAGREDDALGSGDRQPSRTRCCRSRGSGRWERSMPIWRAFLITMACAGSMDQLTIA